MSIPLPTIVSCGCPTAADASPPQSIIIAARSIIRQPGVLDPGLLAYYPLGPFGGTDISGRANHATPRIEDPATRQGILCEQAEVMDGTQTYTLPFALTDVITVSAWLRPTKVNLETTLLSVGDNLRFGLSWSLEPIIWLNERLETQTIISADAISPNRWHHIAFVRDADQYRVYVDGQPVDLYLDGERTRIAITPRPIEPTGDATPLISGYRDGGELHGLAQDVAIRRAAMESHEIEAEYASYCTPFFEVVAP